MARYICKFFIAVLCLLAVATPSVAGTITLTESSFLTPPADTIVLGTGSSTATTVSGYRNISLAVDPGEGRNHYELIDGFSYDPSAQGAVTSASFSIDFRRTFSSTPLATQTALWMVVQQGGTTYDEFATVTTSTSFVNFTNTDITALFPLVDWVSGGEILFGFGNSAFAGGGIGFTIDGGYDNFEVTVNFDESTISEPGTLVVFGLGLIGIGYMRRRRGS